MSASKKLFQSASGFINATSGSDFEIENVFNNQQRRIQTPAWETQIPQSNKLETGFDMRGTPTTVTCADGIQRRVTDYFALSEWRGQRKGQQIHLDIDLANNNSHDNAPANKVKVHAQSSGNKFGINSQSTTTTDSYGVAPALNLIAGKKYIFDLSDSSLATPHPFKFSTTSDGTHGGGTEYTTGVTFTGTVGTSGAKVEITPSTAGTLYYYCANHSGMGGVINVYSSSSQLNNESPTWIARDDASQVLFQMRTQYTYASAASPGTHSSSTGFEYKSYGFDVKDTQATSHNGWTQTMNFGGIHYRGTTFKADNYNLLCFDYTGDGNTTSHGSVNFSSGSSETIYRTIAFPAHIGNITPNGLIMILPVSGNPQHNTHVFVADPNFSGVQQYRMLGLKDSGGYFQGTYGSNYKDRGHISSVGSGHMTLSTYHNSPNSSSDAFRNVNQSGITYRCYIFQNTEFQSIRVWENNNGTNNTDSIFPFSIAQWILYKSMEDSSSGWTVQSKNMHLPAAAPSSNKDIQIRRWDDSSNQMEYNNSSNSHNNAFGQSVGYGGFQLISGSPSSGGFRRNANWSSGANGMEYLAWGIRDQEYAYPTTPNDYTGNNSTIWSMTRSGQYNLTFYSSEGSQPNWNGQPTGSAFYKPQRYQLYPGYPIGGKGFEEQQKEIIEYKKFGFSIGSGKQLTGYSSNANGWGSDTWGPGNTMNFHTFKKQKGFFSQFSYTGTAQYLGNAGYQNTDNNIITHDLGFKPAFILVAPVNMGATQQIIGQSGWNIGNYMVAACYVPAVDQYRISYYDGSGISKMFGPDYVNNDPPISINSADSALLATDTTFNPHYMVYNQQGSQYGITGNLSSGTSGYISPNINNVKYYVQMWAYNPELVSCGTYSVGSSTDGQYVDVGFVPQWVLIKHINGNGGTQSYKSWIWYDDHNGMALQHYATFGNPNGGWRSPDGSNANASPNYSTFAGVGKQVGLDGSNNPSEGFRVNQIGNTHDSLTGETYWYLAIKQRYGKKVLTRNKDFTTMAKGRYLTGNEQERVRGSLGGDHGASFWLGWKPDYAWILKETNSAQSSGRPQTNAIADTAPFSRHWDLGNNDDLKNSDPEEYSGYTNNTYGIGDFSSGSTTDNDSIFAWKRQTGAFDLIAYKGNGTSQQVKHRLGKNPEMIVFHRHATTNNDLSVWHKDLSSQHYLHLGANNNSAEISTSPSILAGYSDSVLSLGSNIQSNNSGPYNTYTAALWCSVPGLVKVGSYTGNSNSVGVPQTINTGINSALAYFIIKAVDRGGIWYVCASKVDYANDWYYGGGGSNYFFTSLVGGQTANINWNPTITGSPSNSNVGNVGFTASGGNIQVWNYAANTNNALNYNETGQKYIYYAVGGEAQSSDNYWKTV